MQEISENYSKISVPLSLVILLVSAIVFCISLVPPIGFILMFFMAPIWSVFLVNLAFLMVFFDVFYRNFSKYLLLAPVIYFGGYGLFTTLSHIQGSGFVIKSVTGANFPQLTSDQSLGIAGRFEIDGVDFLKYYDLKSFIYEKQTAWTVQKGGCNYPNVHIDGAIQGNCIGNYWS